MNAEHADLLNNAVEAAQSSVSDSLGHPIRIRVGVASVGGDVVTVSVKPERLVYDPVVRATMSPAFVLSTTERHHPRLLVTTRLTPAVMDACRRFGIACIDTDGNVLMRWADSVIDIEGRPPTTSRSFGASSNGSLITARSGLQLLFVLLAFPELLDATVRTLATAADISTGSVSKVLGDLQTSGQLRDVRGERRLEGRAELVDTFVDGYRRRLYPRLSIGTFSAENPTWWRDARSAVAGVGGQWGGESALWLQRRLRPARGLVYLDALQPGLIADLRMRRDPGSSANAEFRRRFWRVESDSRHPAVPALLVYSDLVADGDPRLLEAAATLRDTSPEVFGS